MEIKDLEKIVNENLEVLNDLYIKLEIPNKIQREKELDEIISDPIFWSSDNTKNVLEESKNIKNILNKYNTLKDSFDVLKDMFTLELGDDDIENIYKEINNLNKNINDLKISTFLGGKYDSSSAYVEIHSGAGGTESNDWANMLLRMYTRFFEKNDYKYEIISKNDGEEVGIKGVVLLVKGYYPFGYLKGETGVHRLVRISPFDSNSRRHTSFASVLVTPEIDKNLDVEIKDSDLKIDVYRSSGAGGQGERLH